MRVATDIGGTFTDLVYLDEASQRVDIAKVATTPDQFEQGVLTSLEKAALDPAQIDLFVHGTTIVINAITERKGAKTGLLVTAGFRDMLEIQRGNRPDLYNPRYRKPVPFVPRRARLEAEERLSASGDVVRPLVEADVLQAAAEFRRQEVAAVAVCFLHAYANPDHERRARDILVDALNGVSVTASHEVTREWREYERCSTAVLNAYVQPVADSYLASLETRLTEVGCRAPRYVMHNNGGTSSFEAARRKPITMVECGPVAGVLGAAEIGRLHDRLSVISLDIGGTTAKCSLVEHGELAITTDYTLERTRGFAGFPVKTPAVDIVEIGAGGGSIAWLDDAGGLQVGPHSAGAVPGPACYDRGGRLPSVTDANLLAGRLDAQAFLGGEMILDVDAAAGAMQPIADRFVTSVAHAALGVLRVANASMVNALKLISIQRGHDPRDFTLVASGGAGPLHATSLARELRIPSIIIPPMPGVFSAWGMLMTDLRFDLVQTRLIRSDAASSRLLEDVWQRLEADALTHFSAEGVGQDRVTIHRHAEMRYVGQEHTVRVSAPSALDDDAAFDELIERFSDLHERQYTFRLDAQCEFVTFGVTALGTGPKPASQTLRAGRGSDRAAVGRRDMLVGEAEWLDAVVYDRERLGSGDVVDGPALIAERTATTLLLPGDRAEVQSQGSMLIEVHP